MIHHQGEKDKTEYLIWHMLKDPAVSIISVDDVCSLLEAEEMVKSL